MKNMKTLLATLSVLTLGTTVGNLSNVLNLNTITQKNINNDIKKQPHFSELNPIGLEHNSILCWETINNTILVGTFNKDNDSSLYKSTNGGNTFTKIENTGINPKLTITSLLNVNDTIYAATKSGGVADSINNSNDLYKSTNGGNTFTKIENTGINPKLTITSLLNINDTIYAATYNGLWKSIDDGKHFDKLTAVNLIGIVTSLIISNDGTIYAACTTSMITGDLYKSTDGGNTFTKILTPNIHGFICSLLNVNGTIYAGTITDNFKDPDKEFGNLYTMTGNTFTKIENTGIVKNGVNLPITSLLNVNGTIYVQSLGVVLYKQNN